MHVNPRKVEAVKTRNPRKLLKINTIIDKKIKIIKERRLYFIFVMFFEIIFAKKIVKKKAIIPAKKIVKRIVSKLKVVSSGISLLTATAAPVLALEIE